MRCPCCDWPIRPGSLHAPECSSTVAIPACKTAVAIILDRVTPEKVLAERERAGRGLAECRAALCRAAILDALNVSRTIDDLKLVVLAMMEMNR